MSYTVTARTPDGETVWLDISPDLWLLMVRRPIYLEHGPRIKDVVWAAVRDAQLTDVKVTEVENPT